MAKIKPLPILVVDDEKAIRLVHSSILSKYFKTVLVAENGEEAWEIFKSMDEIPVVITDVEMPVRNGVWLVNRIRQSNPATKIIIISAFTKNSVSIFSVYNNISFLPKPVDEMHLRLAALKAYENYPESLWVQKVRDALFVDNPDENYLLELLHNDPWRWHSNISSQIAKTKVAPADTLTPPKVITAERTFTSLEAVDEIFKAKHALGEDYFEVFKEEINDILERAEHNILCLESNPDNPELIAEIFRDFHSMKGNCGMMGFAKLQQLAHNLEDIFSEVRNGDLHASAQIVDLSLQAKDFIIKILDDEKTNELDKILQSLQTGIKKYIP